MGTVADYTIERLYAWGVRRIFGYPGDGVNGLVAAVDRFERSRRGEAIAFVQVRHEEQAAFMATAHAKFTGELGVCLATSGPGAIHLLNGLYDAKADHVPVLAIAGQAATSAIGSEYQQEVDLPSLFKDVAGAYVATVVAPAQARHCIDRAIRTALASHTVTALFFPKDVQERKAPATAKHEMNFVASSVGLHPGRLVPSDDAIALAAEVLNAGTKVAMLVGAGAAGAEAELIEVADALQAGCAKALLGKAVLPDDLPWVTGTIGLLGTRASSDMMRDCDTLLMVGTNFPYAQFLPKEGSARGVQIDTSGARLGMRYPTEVNLQGDARSTLRALLPHLTVKTDASWRDKIAKDREDEAAVSAARARVEGRPVNPERVFIELNERLPDDCIVTADAGTSTNWAARHLAMRRGMRWSLSGGLATMGSAVPYAIAAKLAFDDRVVVALTGDGAMQMNGMNDSHHRLPVLADLERPAARVLRRKQSRFEPSHLGDAHRERGAQVSGIPISCGFPVRRIRADAGTRRHPGRRRRAARIRVGRRASRAAAGGSRGARRTRKSRCSRPTFLSSRRSALPKRYSIATRTAAGWWRNRCGRL